MHSKHYYIVCLGYFVVTLFVCTVNKHNIKYHFLMFENYLVLSTYQAFVLLKA